MRVLDAFVLCESLLLGALGVAWLLRTTDRPDRSAAMPEGISAQGAGTGRVAAVADHAPKEPSAATPRRSVDTSTGKDTAGLIVLRGRLLPAAGMEIPRDLSIGFRAGGRYRGAEVLGDQYAVAGLTPGDWIARPYGDGVAIHEEIVTITSAESQVHDLHLLPTSKVKVFLKTLDGQPLLAKSSDPRTGQYYSVLATREPLHGNLPATDSSTVGIVGLGRFSNAHSFGSRQDFGGADGILQLDEPPPLNAAFLMRHVVLAQQVIPAGATTITFALDRAAVEARFATVRVRLIDGVTGQPILADAHIGFTTAQGGGVNATVGDGGVWMATQVLPGITHMDLGAKDRESLSTDFRVEAGATVELGDITLQPEVQLRGVLLDPQGEPVSGTLQWTDLDIRRARGTTSDRRSTSADGDGEFAIGAGPHRYLVTGRDPDGAVGSATVDARNGAPPRFELRLADPVLVQVVANGDPLRGFALELTDASGRLVDARHIEARWRETAFRVAPGDYTLEVYDESETLLRKIPVHARGELVRLEVQ